MKKTLALQGGRPVRSRFLGFHRPWFDKREEQAVLQVLRSGWVTRGPKTNEFERRFGRFVQSKYSLGLNSCTAALHLGMIGAGVGKGDEVITSPMGFAASANTIVELGAKPVFVDVEPDTLNIDPDKIKSKITRRTKAILPIDFAGSPCQMSSIKKIARRYGVWVIEDAAHGLGALHRGKRIGSMADVTAFSFYATKNITTGEGGMLTTPHKKLMDRIKPLSLHGISRDAWSRDSVKGYQHWNIIAPGYKYNMFDLQAALGLEQLKKLGNFLKKRKQIVQIYNKAFKQIPEIRLLKPHPGDRPAYHLYVITVKTENLNAKRDTILHAIEAENIGVGVHFRAIHLHPFYKKLFGFKKGRLPNAEYASERVISLPLYPSLTRSDVRDVIGAVIKVIKAYR
jgi:dTDP-4-amino-4,6-dideoxygalactose transaminase